VGRIRDSPLLRSDVKARHDTRTRCGKPQIPSLKPQTPNPKHQGRAGRDRMVGLVETMQMTADGLQLTAYGLGLGRQRGSRLLDTLNWCSMIVSE